MRHPKRTLAVAALVTLAVAPGALFLELRTDGHALVPPHAPEIQIDRRVREAFGVRDPIVVLIRSHDPNGIFNVQTLRLVKTLTNEFLRIDGVRPEHVFSLETEPGDRVRPGTLYFRTFLEAFPTTPVELKRLRDDLRAIRLYTGTLVALDETATAIMVGVPPSTDRMETLRAIRDIVASQELGGDDVHIIGAPIAEALLGTHILEDLGIPAALLGERTFGEDETPPWRIPTSLHELRTLVARRIGLLPIALLVMAAVFFVGFRSVPAVVLPLMEVGACLAFVFGLMGWLGVPVYLTIAVLPIVLTAIGVADEVHIIDRYRELLRRRPTDPHLTILGATMAEMRSPVVKTSVTTAIGFLSFAVSDIRPVQAFGVFTAVGIFFCMAWSLMVTPALLSMIHPDRITVRHASYGGMRFERGRRSARLATAIMRLRWPVALAAVMLTVVAPLGVRRLAVQDSWIDGFSPESEFRRATTQFNEQFLGMHTLYVAVDAGGFEPIRGTIGVDAVGHKEIRLPPDVTVEPAALVGCKVLLNRPDEPGSDEKHPRNILYVWDSLIESARRDGDRIVLTPSPRDGSPRFSMHLRNVDRVRFLIRAERLIHPKFLRVIEAFETFIKQHRNEAVGGVIGTANLLATTNFIARARAAGSRSIPDTYDRVEWLWGQYKRIRGPERFGQIISDDYRKALVSVQMKNANFIDTDRLMKDIRRYEREHLKPLGMSIEFAGDVAVSQTLIDAIVKTQVRSLLISLVGILAVTTLLGRSLRWGLLCVLPCALAVLANFAVMGWTGMPLGVATSMFAGMTLGIGVDYAIHLMERYRLAQHSGLAGEAAVTDAVAATGPAVTIDAFAVALGFGVMLLSQVPANARLGALVMLSIAGCYAATMLLLPALLRILRL